MTTEEENYNFRSSGRYSIYNEGTEIAENSQIVSVIITPDDKYVIAGSRHWPPQVWDIDVSTARTAIYIYIYRVDIEKVALYLENAKTVFNCFFSDHTK